MYVMTWVGTHGILILGTKWKMEVGSWDLWKNTFIKKNKGGWKYHC